MTSRTKHHVPLTQHWLGCIAARTSTLLQWIGNRETELLPQPLPPVHQPIYITGLARAGTTLLLEWLTQAENTASHRYRDYPFLLTPLWWHYATVLSGRKEQTARERSHADGMMVTADSPEAMEEMVWLHFFPQLRETNTDKRLGAQVQHPAFERFYNNHIQKLLWLRGAKRYVAKNNQLIARLPYLLARYPDMRVVVAVRDPLTHIPSLMRQHERFTRMADEDPRVADYFLQTGHREFGPHRLPPACATPQEQQQIMACWKDGRELEGWAHSWAASYGALNRLQQENPALRAAIHIVSYEALCAAPQQQLAQLFAHCGLPAPAIMAQSASIHAAAPSTLTTAEQAQVRALTAAVATNMGYGC